MKLETLIGSENYQCQVIRLPQKQKIEHLDNLVQVTYQGNQCLVGKDSNPDELYLFFPAECCLNEDFLKYNNLYRHKELNHDPLQTGFFEDTGRVKAIKFKGVISTGFIIPLTSLTNFCNNDDYKELQVCDEFNSINNQEVCKKYKKIFQQSSGSKESRHNKKLKRFDKLIDNQFRFHQDTSHLAKNLHQFSPDDIIVITDKWHGTSAIFANVLVKKELNWKEKIAKFFGVKVVDREYDVLYASRKILKNQYINKDVQPGYYNEDIWKTVLDKIQNRIAQGITLYGEIVGYLSGGKSIQKSYDYGCDPNNGEHKFLVYRITYTKRNGEVIEYSWQQIKEYCKKYELETVKELYFGSVMGYALDQPNFGETLLKYVSDMHLREEDCKYCINKVPAEGICVRIDGKESYHTYKLKSKRFLEHETKELDKQTEINIEDITDENMVPE